MKLILTTLLILITVLGHGQYCPYLGPDQLLPCGINSTTLTADLSQCGPGGPNPNQTTNYGVTNIPYVAQTNTGTNLTMGDDTQQGPFNIGFNFCFFGQTYTQFYVGSNGWISFSSGQSTTFTSFPIPNAGITVPKNCIMGPWQDWHPGLGGQIKYQVQGVAPCRKLIVSWVNVPMFSCTNLNGTFHIVIYESTNYIENHIQNKPSCLQWQSGTATQGIHNLLGTVGITSPGRNSTAWTTVNNSYRWTPSGPTVTPTLTWYQVGNPNPIGTGPTITVTPPPAGANYTCQFVYPTCNAGWSTCNVGIGNLGPDTVFVQPGPPQLPPPNLVLQDPHCNNGCDGSIIVTPNGGTGVTTISWNGGSTNLTLNNLCSGNYLFNLVDAAGCTYSGSATLLNPPPLQSPQFANTNPTCFGYCDGTSTVNPIDGVSPYTFLWGNSQTTQTVTNLCSGQQTVTVYDQYNCPAQGTTTLVDPPMVTVNQITGLDTVCYNSTVNPYGVTSVFPNLGYVWTNTIGNITTGQGTDQINLDVTGVNGGNYSNSLSVIGVNQLGCQSLPETFNLVVLNILPSITQVGPFCEYDNCINLNGTPQGGIFNGLNVWNGQYCPNNGFIGLDVVNYDYFQSGCLFNTSINVQIYPRPLISPVVNGVVFENTEYHEICEGDTITDMFDAVSPNGGYNEWYSFGDTTISQTLNITWDQDGIFQFQVVRWDNGCVSNPETFIITLELCPNEIFYIPNTFTPNGDEYNTLWGPVFTSGYDKYGFELLVFNRWGNIIWESKDPEGKWDGTYGNKPCPDGVYPWKIVFSVGNTDEKKEIHGFITLIR
jgi:gliding motility-associated-like protein